jgi:hypothetical protein
MHFRRWLVHISMSATLIIGSAVCAGWKWDRLPPF